MYYYTTFIYIYIYITYIMYIVYIFFYNLYIIYIYILLLYNLYIYIYIHYLYTCITNLGIFDWEYTIIMSVKGYIYFTIGQVMASAKLTNIWGYMCFMVLICEVLVYHLNTWGCIPLISCWPNWFITPIVIACFLTIDIWWYMIYL